jgi:hypothetical protein
LEIGNVVETHCPNAILPNRIFILTIARRVHAPFLFGLNPLSNADRPKAMTFFERVILLTMKANSRKCIVLE